jgi:hypothetical protein
MRRSRTTKPIPISIKMTAGLLAGLLFAILAVPLGAAQPASETRTGHGFGVVYDAAHEITFTGSVQEVVTRRMPGRPAGMHLMVVGPQGLVDAHVGPFLSREIKDALHTGTPVQLVGAMASLRGKNFLMVRELNVGGTKVIVRSEHGFLVRSQGVNPKTKDKETASVVSNGGAR